ncbi:VWA domain-containing protein [Actinomadura madurae]|uniref:VWA domain-containing protein n=1 Tax=Actinomadura madurae TaxID=1993 RepID=UPI0035585E61
MSFLDPVRLFLLLALPVLIAAYVVMQVRRGRYAVRFTNLALLDKVAPTRPGWRRHVPAAAFLLMLGLFVTGFARPTADVRVPREQATIVLALDVSHSMQATDVEPTRLEGAKQAARTFLDQVPDRFNVGLVSFSGSASVIVAPTTDRQAMRTGIDGLRLGPRTAIGEGVLASLDSIAGFGAQFGEEAPPRTSSCSRTGRTPPGGAPRRPSSAPRRPACRCRRSPTAPRRASCTRTGRRSRCRSTDRRWSGWRGTPAGATTRPRPATSCAACTRTSAAVSATASSSGRSGPGSSPRVCSSRARSPRDRCCGFRGSRERTTGRRSTER